MLPPNVDSLAAFKRFLAKPNAAVEVIRHDYARSLYRDPAMIADAVGFRRIKEVQSKAVAFELLSGKTMWLDLKSAKQFRFEGDTVTVVPNPDDPREIVYRLTFADTATQSAAA